MSPAPHRRLSPVLARDALYLAPSGRTCRWRPKAEGEEHDRVFFDYVGDGGRLVEGFTLRRSNLRLLKRVA